MKKLFIFFDFVCFGRMCAASIFVWDGVSPIDDTCDIVVHMYGCTIVFVHLTSLLEF